MWPSRVPHGRDVVAWPFSRLWRVSDPTLFQMTIIAALWVAVFGKCGPPPDVPGAFPERETNQTDFASRTVLRYSCRPGYSRATSSHVIYCAHGGDWQIGISCVKKSCGNPGDLQNGQVEVKTDFYFGSQIEFSCSEGYFLIGSSTSYCEIQSKGVAWSNPLPECEIVKCSSPPDISNGKHNGGYEDVYTYGSSVTYRCDPTFSLVGNASITCTVVNKTVGVWSPSPPTCERIRCPQPNVSHRIITSGFRTTYKYKDSISFACPKWSILRGKNIIHCGADGNWNFPPPFCELTGCTNIPNIPHASWLKNLNPQKDLYPVGTVLHYQCHPGYEPSTKEPMTVVCKGDLSWSPFKGCKEVCCPEPDPNNVRVIGHEKTHPKNDCTYFYDDTVTYKCHNDLVFSATCKSDGTWNPKTPLCDKNCGFPSNIAHGRIKSKSFFSTMVTYECDKGYRLVGQASISCLLPGWFSAPPKCKALCQKPEISNGMLSASKDEYVESENVTIQCDTGFTMLGSQSITCSENGTWYPEVPRCAQAKDCEPVFAGKRFMQCLPSSADVKMALEVYKLSLEIELLELQIEKAKQTAPEL
ncbi:C4b-binding protein alpha chain isoform X2 [Phodopus roborovskii]|uniref:C4b-binding protein alpha chain isoform X2 n=1 Tax=Phodopus roborovskii TaxID=109678 RepID=UPI0021E50E40|nr:C4b-binding protein alpha chain isoform X2 [Phodopus roborovskii]